MCKELAPKFEELTIEQINALSNNCGPSFCKVPDFRFAACCQKHDYSYLTSCNQKDRLLADKTFLKCMLKKSQGNWFYKAMSYVYYRAVRIGGKNRCRISDHKLTMDEFNEMIKAARKLKTKNKRVNYAALISELKHETKNR